MRELGDLLRELDPAPGGLQRLQRAVEAHDEPRAERRSRVRFAAVMGSSLALVLAVSYLPGMLTARRHAVVIRDAMRQTLMAPQDGIYVEHGSALELPSGQATARIYLVETSTPASQ